MVLVRKRIFFKKNSRLFEIVLFPMRAGRMTTIDHHSIIGSPNCTNATSATVRCARAAAVVVSVGVQTDRRLAHVAMLSLLLHSQGVRLFLPVSRVPSPQFLFRKYMFAHRCFSVAFA